MASADYVRIQQEKEKLRAYVWEKMEAAKVGAFPFPLRGRIPNFKGAAQAARLFAASDIFAGANYFKVNPDAPQRYTRIEILKAGKSLFMAAPRLKAKKPMWHLKAGPGQTPREMVSIKNAPDFAKHRTFAELPEIDLIVAGSVAVNRKGYRLGKGGGYSDLEFAIAKSYGKITKNTIIVSIVHPLQIMQSNKNIPKTSHDIPVDYIITPDEIIQTNTKLKRPKGIVKSLLKPEYKTEIPALQKLLD